MELKVTNDAKHISKTPEAAERFTPEQKTKLAKASRDFESLMTSMMIKSMSKNSQGFWDDEGGMGGDVFQSMFENEISSMISKSNSLGVASKLYRKITGEDLPADVLKKVAERIEKEAPETEMPAEELKKAEPVLKTEKAGPAVTPGKGAVNRLNKYDGIIDEASRTYGIDQNIIKSVILAESAANEKAQSPVKAKGLMQLMDSTARELGVKNVWNPRENILGGAKYLSGLLRQYNGDLKLALAAYNAGPGNVEKYNGVPPFSETKSYISRVMGYLNHLNG